MKKNAKFIIRIIISLAVIYLVLNIVVFVFGKALLVKQIQNLTHRKTNIDQISLAPSLNLEIKNLDIEGLARANYISASPSILSLFTGSITLNSLKLIGPRITYERKPAPAQGAVVSPAIPASQSKAGADNKRLPLRLIIKHLSIKDGTLNFIDRTVGGDGIKFTVKDIGFNLANLYLYPRSAITKFEFKGKIPWQEGKQEGSVEAGGWLNLFKKDMQATLKINDIDGLYLYPYYAIWVNLEKARIENTKLNFISDIKSVDNNLTAECRLELTDIVFKPRSAEEPEDKAERIAAAVLDIFKALNKGKIVFNFTIRTKMVSPQFSFDYIKAAFQDKLAEGRKNNQITGGNIAMLPAKVLGGTIKSATELSRALIGGTFSVGKEVKKAFEYAFKRDR